MNSIINQTIRWIVRHFLSLVLILAVLIVGNFIQKEFRDYKSSEDEVSALKKARQEINEYRFSNERKVSERVAKLKSASQQLLNSEIEVIDKEIKRKQHEQKNLSLNKYVLGSKDYTENKKLEIELILLEQERSYLASIYTLKSAYSELERLRKIHIAAYKKLKVFDNGSLIPPVFSLEHHKYYAANHAAYENYQTKLKQTQALEALKRHFELSRKKINEALHKLNTKINDLEKRISMNWIHLLKDKVSNAVSEVIMEALQILVLLILIPIAIKLFFYFVLAPLASRRPAICILPEVSGTIEEVNKNWESELTPTKISAVSLQLNIHVHQELLIHPEYIQSSSVLGKKDTKWLLSNSFPFSSLLSGMVALTRISTDVHESIVISATKDPLSEVGLFSIPDGSAFVLQPRSLVGVLQRKDLPMQITRHWRLFSLHSWLTLQLRYLVFHGPVTLIVKGCRGVRLEKAGTGRRVSQAATIGFSANLKYSTTRCETFFPYLTSKQELLNDGFAGESGFYIYEEMPHYGKNSGLASRGLEGFADSLLKIFGV